jgi:hypothetical protein
MSARVRPTDFGCGYESLTRYRNSYQSKLGFSAVGVGEQLSNNVKAGRTYSAPWNYVAGELERVIAAKKVRAVVALVMMSSYADP